MTTLVTIPNAKALHIPTPGATPLPLATGDLNVLLIPANPPTHPSDTITISIGASAFPLIPSTPVQKVKAKAEHPSYTFSPAAPVGSEPIGSVLLEFGHSTSQEQWDALEFLCKRLESVLRTHNLWEEKIKFVNDEYDTAGEPVKGWGDSLAGAVTAGASFIAAKVQGLADNHIGTAKPINPTLLPSAETAGRASGIRNATAHLAANAEQTAVTIGNKVHEAGRELGQKLPEELRPAPKSATTTTSQAEKGELQKLAEEGWEQSKIAAQGIAAAAITVGKSLSDNTHRAVEHNFGKESDRVAQDIGQTGANLASTAGSAFTGTSVVIQGANAYQGVQEAQTTTPATTTTTTPAPAPAISGLKQ